MYLLSLAWDSLLPVTSVRVTLHHVVSFPFSLPPAVQSARIVFRFGGGGEEGTKKEQSLTLGARTCGGGGGAAEVHRKCFLLSLPALQELK